MVSSRAVDDRAARRQASTEGLAGARERGYPPHLDLSACIVGAPQAESGGQTKRPTRFREVGLPHNTQENNL